MTANQESPDSELGLCGYEDDSQKRLQQLFRIERDGASAWLVSALPDPENLGRDLALERGNSSIGVRIHNQTERQRWVFEKIEKEKDGQSIL